MGIFCSHRQKKELQGVLLPGPLYLQTRLRTEDGECRLY